MPWISLTIRTNAAQAEILSDRLIDFGALSVDIHDAAAGTIGEQMLFGEPGEPIEEIWLDAEVTALFPEEADVSSVMADVTQISQLSKQPDYSLAYVEEQDWVRLTQAQFSPIQISSRLWIVPTWHQPPDPAAINLILDPGLAFGTGSHPTTKLCLSWLDKNLKPGESVVDYGCGSGILAIAALKLGASHVTGVDIDPHAITASYENSERNQCDQSALIFSASHVATAENKESRIYADVVIANILANPLIILAPILADSTCDGGHIVLSGILQEQANEVITTYQQWFQIQVTAEDDGWVLLAGVKKQFLL